MGSGSTVGHWFGDNNVSPPTIGSEVYADILYRRTGAATSSLFAKWPASHPYSNFPWLARTLAATMATSLSSSALAGRCWARSTHSSGTIKSPAPNLRSSTSGQRWQLQRGRRSTGDCNCLTIYTRPCIAKPHSVHRPSVQYSSTTRTTPIPSPSKRNSSTETTSWYHL